MRRSRRLQTGSSSSPSRSTLRRRRGRRGRSSIRSKPSTTRCRRLSSPHPEITTSRPTTSAGIAVLRRRLRRSSGSSHGCSTALPATGSRSTRQGMDMQELRDVPRPGQECDKKPAG